jgi:thiol-disulfide isomerase/thioredoxin
VTGHPVANDAPEITWQRDDLDAALAVAKASGKPLLVDMWAPWCHTCLSMKHTVLADPGLRPLADRFVWVAIDTDKPRNAGAVERLPMEFWPTFFVLDPEDGAVVGRHVGAASVTQFRGFLLEGERALLAGRDALPESDPLFHLRAAAQAQVRSDHAAADAAYAAAFERAPADWARAPEVLVAWIGARYRTDADRCVTLAEDRLSQVFAGHTASAADFTYYAHACAGSVGSGRAHSIRERAERRLAALAADADAPLAVDDRSEALRILRELRTALGDESGARAAAVTQRDLLAAAFREAENPHAAMTYNWPRAEVHVFLGEAAALVPDLEASVKALPDAYDPPYRLAWVLLELGRADDAVGPAEQALRLVYGPRKRRVLTLLAGIHEARGDAAARAKAYESLLAHEETLPAHQRSADAVKSAREALGR